MPHLFCICANIITKNAGGIFTLNASIKRKQSKGDILDWDGKKKEFVQDMQQWTRGT